MTYYLLTIAISNGPIHSLLQWSVLKWLPVVCHLFAQFDRVNGVILVFASGPTATRVGTDGSFQTLYLCWITYHSFSVSYFQTHFKSFPDKVNHKVEQAED